MICCFVALPRPRDIEQEIKKSKENLRQVQLGDAGNGE